MAQMNLSMPEESIELIREAAARDRASISAWVLKACEQRLGIEEMDLLAELEDLKRRVSQLEGVAGLG